jgi:hypothetical protein
MELTKSQEQKLRHMLGAETGRYPKRSWGFRNHYACGRENDGDLEELLSMVDAGLLTKGREAYKLVFFHATEAGCRAVGLKGKQIRNALGD